MVGSGPSGVAAASALVEQGHAVEVLDVGHKPDAASQALAGEMRATIGRGERPGRALYRALHPGPAAAAFAARRPRHAARPRRGDALAEAHPRLDLRVGRRRRRDPRRERGRDALAREGRLVERMGRGLLPVAARRTSRAGPIAAAELAPHYARAAALLGLDQGKDALERGPTRCTAPSGERRAAQPGLAARALLGALARARRASWPPPASRRAARASRCAATPARAAGSASTAAPSARSGTPGSRSTRSPFATGRAASCRASARRPAAYASTAASTARRSTNATTRSCRGRRALVAAHRGRLARPPRPRRPAARQRAVPAARAGARAHGRPSASAAASRSARRCWPIEAGVVSARPLHVQLYSFHEFFLAELGDLLRALPGPAPGSGLGGAELARAGLRVPAGRGLDARDRARRRRGRGPGPRAHRGEPERGEPRHPLAPARAPAPAAAPARLLARARAGEGHSLRLPRPPGRHAADAREPGAARDRRERPALGHGARLRGGPGRVPDAARAEPDLHGDGERDAHRGLARRALR